MKETNVNYFDILNKIFICLVIIIALLALNLVYNVTSSGGSNTSSNEDTTQEETLDYDVSAFEQVNEEEALALFDNKEPTVIYFGSPTCGFCASFIPTMEAVQETYGFKHYYLDVSAISDTDAINDMVELMTVESVQDATKTYGDDFGITPMVIVVEDGEMTYGTLGAVDIDSYSSMIEEAGFKEN